MSFVKHAVVAAAGLGSRLGHGKPKSLVQMNGISLLEHIMSLLSGVEDVRVVVGFMEHDIITELERIRPNAIIVRNPGFRNTTTLHSYELGSRHLKGDCLYMDADLLVVPETFESFLQECRPGEPRLAVTRSKTTDAVYTNLEGQSVISFQREKATEFEWSNISWLPVGFFRNIGHTAVYEHLTRYLPLAVSEVVSYEIDTADDLMEAKLHAELFRNAALS